LLVFWLAVHLENLEIVDTLIKKEDIAKKAVAVAFLKDHKTSMSHNESDQEQESPNSQ
jgi:hypothetical protein